jgi:acetyl-CoA carboxylase biotin carboxyl carrier protein
VASRKKTARGKARGAGAAASASAAAARPSAYPEVEELVRLMDRHGLLEVDYESAPDGSRRIRVSRTSAPGSAASHAPATGGGVTHLAAHAVTTPARAEAPPAAPGETLHAFKSPMVGSFYRAPSPDAPPFVSVGDRVDPQVTVCIIEAMKVMNEIVPDVSGEVVSIEVENGEAVEYGQTLFLIRPS